MDAVEFVKNYTRMCTAIENCEECPCIETDFCKNVSPKELDQKDAEEVVRRVEEWAVAHPVKTRADEFLKHYPKASMGVAGVLDVPPCYIEPSLRSMCSEKVCADCRREFWMQEVE